MRCYNKVSVEDGEIKQDFAIGEGYTMGGTIAVTGTKKGDSPFEFYVLPATSDTENSNLGSVDGSGAAAPANACTLADTAAATATAAANAALDAAAFEAGAYTRPLLAQRKHILWDTLGA